MESSPTKASTTRTRPATLWIGDQLSVVEKLCLTSLVRHGMEPVFYQYTEVLGVPPGVEVRDGREIVPSANLYRTEDRKSYATFSDYFRYRMLLQEDYYWVDADVYAMGPIKFQDDYLAAWMPPYINNAVFSLPKSSPTLEHLISISEKPNIDLPWLHRWQADLAGKADTQGNLKREDLPYKALGPMAVTWLMKYHGESDQAMRQESHNPLMPRHVLKPSAQGLHRIRRKKPQTIHLFGNMTHRALRDTHGGIAPEGSSLAHLLEKDGFGRSLFD